MARLSAHPNWEGEQGDHHEYDLSAHGFPLLAHMPMNSSDWGDASLESRPTYPSQDLTPSQSIATTIDDATWRRLPTRGLPTMIYESSHATSAGASMQHITSNPHYTSPGSAGQFSSIDCPAVLATAADGQKCAASPQTRHPVGIAPSLSRPNQNRVVKKRANDSKKYVA